MNFLEEVKQRTEEIKKENDEIYQQHFEEALKRYKTRILECGSEFNSVTLSIEEFDLYFYDRIVSYFKNEGFKISDENICAPIPYDRSRINLARKRYNQVTISW